MSEQQFFFIEEDGFLGKTTEKKYSRKTDAFKQYSCETCGLYKDCNSPKMRRFGKGKKRILVIGLCPGREEDKQGIQFVGESGMLVESTFDALGINFERDCVRTNIVQCRPTNDRGENRAPTNVEMLSCFSRLEEDIEYTDPKLIICLGEEAINSVLRPSTLDAFSAGKVHGLVFPSQEYKCWVGCAYHPASRPAGIRGGKRGRLIFGYDMVNIVEFLDKQLPKPLSRKGNVFVEDSGDAIELLKMFSRLDRPVAFDYETTCASPYAKDATLLTVSLSDNIKYGYLIPLHNLSGMKEWNSVELSFVYGALKEFLVSNVPKIVQGYNMEVLWSRRHVGVDPVNVVHDTMVSHHIVYCRRGTTSLGFQTYLMTGFEYKKMVDTTNLIEEDVSKITDYSGWDARYTLMAHNEQREKLSETGTDEFNCFLTSCLPVLANMKDRGIKVDTNRLDAFEKDTKRDMDKLEREVRVLEPVRRFEFEYGKRFNINAPQQHAELLYKVCGEKIQRKTASGKLGSADEDALKKVMEGTKNNTTKKVVEKILRHKKNGTFLKKVVEYKGLLDPDGYLHPSYMLNVAESYRSASSDPNFQNVFIHDDFLARIRECIVPRYDLFLEGDFSGLEVRKIAMVSGDKVLGDQIRSGIDCHRRWAARIYEKKEKDITKEERFNGKSSFVFASFYGALPEPISKYLDLPLKHIEKIQEDFWKEYKGVRAWQEKNLKFYLDNGYIRGITGFVRPGPLSNEQLYNTPIQGPAFHLVLASLQELDDIMINKKFKTIMINQTHDSVLFDTKLDEVENVIELADHVMCSERFPWQEGIPLSVDWKIGRENWLSLEEI